MATNETNTAASAEGAVPDTPAAKAPGSASRVDRAPSAARVPDGAGAESAGRTTIADGVVAKVAGIAAREVSGVHALGGGGARALGAIRDAVNATDFTQGVKVEVGETQAAADITIVVDYPAPIQDVAENVRQAVTDAITRLVGLQVVEVNIDVNDVHLPSDDADDDSESRVS
ncbi:MULTISPECIES: Asp23/Gls24 family envelope stress response protein [Microbacterium]|uniref:Asp23/Gls24 family envelope stress response protein n=1 Tax=Microbacterium TaxID=33882 RepID=UPI00217EE691|nr:MULTISPECIES: Asp23/Gls24 family envelope stress response protein [Microbacterium]UWF78701.1 Asp23/Gls24 family envelope stress response protein [Microbacterium neungamense]WCM56867.1 Asp23/Gls24 family envelope stress response protein [Microbacterium sp. EF45047]